MKTIFILKWYEDEAYRRRISRQLNNGEALHSLRSYLSVANQGIIRRKDDDGVTNQVSCLNLVTNAVDASEQGSSVEIEAGRRKRKGVPHLAIAVKDTGHGIPQEASGKVFDPFFTTKGPGEGTGLGLSICRNLMEAFGGSIEVSSKPGRSTTFLLLFPLARILHETS